MIVVSLVAELLPSPVTPAGAVTVAVFESVMVADDLTVAETR